MGNNLDNVLMESQTDSLPTDRTSVCHRIVLAPEHMPYIMKHGKFLAAKMIAAKISELFLGLAARLGNQRFVKMENKKVWCDRSVAGLFPCFEHAPLPLYDTKTPHASNYPGLDFEGFHFETMTCKECLRTFAKDSGNPYIKKDGNIKGFSKKAYRNNESNAFILTREVDGGRSSVVDITKHIVSWWSDPDKVVLVPIYRMRKTNAGTMAFADALTAWLELGLMPEGLDGTQKKTYLHLVTSYPALKKYITSAADGVAFQAEQFQQDVKDGKIQDTIFSYDFCDERLMQSIAAGEKTYSGATVDVIRNELLECDKKRADLEPYEAKRLTDLNLGHWELFEESSPDALQLELPEKQYFVARPPQMDVMTNAVCAIDFGTKSTVVACRDQDERLLRIGGGNYAKAAESRDYENPTIISFRDIEAFMKAYQAREGRPYTEWEQVTVSHEAENDFGQIKDSAIYYSVFSELKQWANNKDWRMMIRDTKGHLVEMKPYAELKEGDFDPIELYAYYLGLYINNMHRRICLDYILSFPVTYNMDVRERIRQSFEHGIRKSLPSALLKDEKIMERFRVYAGASEPAAYAISALQEFGLEPKRDGETVSYAVFDFGGGTTDYDFGIERIPEDHRRRFVIERIGRGGGDPHLGGENILALLAYEVYKDNITEMRAKRIPFVLPAKGTLFAGSEMLVKEVKYASHQAHMNSKLLAKKLRGIWERDKDYQNTFGNWDKPIALFSSDSKGKTDTVNVNISIDLPRLEKCIKETIRAGVADFFSEMMHAFDNLESDKIHIFLAGNSCKSPVVKKLFDEYMKIYEKKIADEILHTTTKDKKAKGIFVLHLPLGMKDVEREKEVDQGQVQERNGSKKNRHKGKQSKIVLPQENTDEDAEKSEIWLPQRSEVGDANFAIDPECKEQLDLDKVRTGKTGVVFGLLRSRKGGRDVKIEERDIAEQREIIFPYYLGDIDRDNHFHVRIGRDVPYGKWVEFVPADEAEFELYYTKEARSLDNTLLPQEVKMEKCLIDANEVHDTKNIYICKASPDTIKYAVGDENTNFADGFKGKIYIQPLR